MFRSGTPGEAFEARIRFVFKILTVASDARITIMPPSEHSNMCRHPWLVTFVVALVGTGCGKQHVTFESFSDAGVASDPELPTVDPGVREALDADGNVEVLVSLDEAYAWKAYGATLSVGPRASYDPHLTPTLADTGPSVEALAELYGRVQSALERRLQGKRVEVLTRYDYLPVVHLRLYSEAVLRELSSLSEVAHVFENRKLDAFLMQSLPLVQQPSAMQSFYTGEGTAVAVLDTGCDYTREAFGSCSAAGAQGCKVAYAADFAPNDGSTDDSGHGTNVSAIVLGVAPDTKVLALDVFTGGSSSSSIILQAIDWSIAQRATYNIVAMNMSLGGGLYTSSCGADVFAAPLANARAAGIVPVVATGNNGASNAIASPACAPAAVSVGAVYDANIGGMNFPAAGCGDATTQADKVACFSNSSAQLSLLAPGAMITAAGLSQTGTSQAAPHVAGAVAVVRAAHPEETLTESIARLTTTGPSITDPRNGIARRRLDLAAALDSGPADLTAPTGNVVINAGASATASTTVSLTLSATDAGGVASMCVSNTTTCTAFVTYATSSTWKLASGAGTKTVTAFFKDAVGNVGTATDTIVLDTTKPVDGTLTATGGDASATLAFSGATDAGSGFSGYRLVYALDTAPTSCAGGSVAYSGTATSYVHRGLTNGSSYAYRVCAVDAAGNMSAGKTATTRPAPEYVAPTGSVSINAGASYARSTKATLTLSASDASGVTSMCVSNSASCTSWLSYATSLPWTLGKTSGEVSVNVWFRDRYGNASTAAVSDAIVVDSQVPTLSSFAATPGNARVDLAWQGADTGSGIDTYSVRVASATPPASCEEGTLVYSGTATSFRHSSLTNGSVYGYRLCALDRAGNAAVSKVITARPAPEFNPPSGSVVINAGASYTNSRTVTLTISATDVSGVAAMCISGSATCSNWVNYATSSSFTLTKSSGAASVNAWFRDTFGNASTAAVSDAITIDSAAPVMGALSGTVASGEANLAWVAASDAGSGLASYKLVYAIGATAPASCADGSTAYQGLSTSHRRTGLSAGKVAFRLCASDALGNTSTGKTLVLTVP